MRPISRFCRVLYAKEMNKFETFLLDNINCLKLVQMHTIKGKIGHLRIDVEILQDNSLTERRFIVDPGASIAMSAGSNFEEK